MAGNRGRPEHIKVVDFAEQILHFFEIVAPCFVLDGKKVLHYVAQALDADAQSVKRGLGAVAQGAVVQFAGFGPAFEREMFEQRAAQAKVGGPRRQRSAPLPPFLAVELFARGVLFELLLALAGVADLDQGLG